MKNNTRKEQLLSIAYNMFINKGYENTSIDEIINECGIAKGTYYYYFESKEETLEEVINMMISKEIEEAKKIIEMPIGVEQKIVGVITSLRPKNEEVNIKDGLHSVDNVIMHEKINKKIIDVATPLLKEVIIEGINKKIFNCENIEERIKLILIISNKLFNDNNFTINDINVFIDTTEKILGAKKGTMEFVKTLIGGNNNEKNN